ncbi:hypothetical protein [Lacticigenium naphthae]|uniref:hypothetical protein n=1 Tax=Lacticigenium naphthae TaxID=515351 RepID=UPI00041115B0|nr:hypothetical protein [Lacticigenium naphthae]
MTNYYTKELNVKNHKKVKQFAGEVDRVIAEVVTLKQKKELSSERIPAIKEALTHLVTDVDIINDEGKRKLVLKRKRELQDELDELELFAHMDIESYKQKQLDPLLELGEEASKEYREYSDRTDTLLKEAREELKEKETEILLARRDHSFNKYSKYYDEMKQKARVEQVKAEREKEKIKNEQAKIIHVDKDGNEIVGRVNWKK